MSNIKHIAQIFDETGCLNLRGMRGYLNGTLGRADRAEAAAHLKECELCAEAIGGIELVPEDSTVFGSVGLITAAVREKAGAGPGAGDGGAPSRAWIWQAAAAVAVLAVVTLTIWQSNPADKQNSPAVLDQLAQAEAQNRAKLAQEMDSAVLADRGEPTPAKDDRDSDAELVGETLTRSMESADEQLENEADLDKYRDLPVEVLQKETDAKSTTSVNDMQTFSQSKSPADEKATSGSPKKGTNRMANENNDPAGGNGIKAIPSQTATVASDDLSDDMAGQEMEETIAYEELEDAEPDIGYVKDVYTMDGDGNATYSGTRNDLLKEKKKEEAKPLKQNQAKASKSAATRAISPPAGVYYDSDKMAWNQAQTLQDQGMAQYDVQNYTDAVKSFEEALKVAPENEEARFYCAVSYFELGLYNNAGKHFDEILKDKNSKYQEKAQWYQAELHIRRNEMNEARKLLQKLSKGNGEYKQKATERLKEMD